MTGQAGSGRTVIELDFGITVYPARFDGDRWRAVWHENGERQQCESVQEATLAVKLEKVTERLQPDAPNMKRPGADLIAHYLDPDRLPVDKRWSRRHSDTQRRLCAAVRRPGHRGGHLPGHQDQPHAEDRQRRPHLGGR